MLLQLVYPILSTCCNPYVVKGGGTRLHLCELLIYSVNELQNLLHCWGRCKNLSLVRGMKGV